MLGSIIRCAKACSKSSIRSSVFSSPTEMQQVGVTCCGEVCVAELFMGRGCRMGVTTVIESPIMTMLAASRSDSTKRTAFERALQLDVEDRRRTEPEILSGVRVARVRLEASRSSRAPLWDGCGSIRPACGPTRLRAARAAKAFPARGSSGRESNGEGQQPRSRTPSTRHFTMNAAGPNASWKFSP